jgi:DNA-binding XRE family transcriptional regulator
MAEKGTSEFFKAKRRNIAEKVFSHPSWINSAGFVKHWRPFTRQQIRKLLDSEYDCSDCRVDSLVGMARRIGSNFGKLVDLGDWEYDEVGLGGRIKRYREINDLSQKDLADRCGFEVKYIRNLEEGNTKGGFLMSRMEIFVTKGGLTWEQLFYKLE